MKIAIICGGPSLERGISLNSARSVLDHLESEQIEIVPFYLDAKKNPYHISKAQLYSNTPSDFDFKLSQTAKKLSRTDFVRQLKKTSLVFPIIHGAYGEDGGIQSFLEKYDIPYIGSDAEACKTAFDKYNANEFISKNSFFTLPSAVLKIYHTDHRQIINNFFTKHNIKRAIIKPASGGSSIGVFAVNNPKEALAKTELLFSKRMDTRVVIEPFAVGREFTVIILENRFGLPTAILPTEIEYDYRKHQIFDFRKKYLPTRQVTYHCPPRFDLETIETIQAQAEQLFTLLKMRDFGRFDGWVMPDGRIWFSDFNPISGMEQNSFLFQQASRIGYSHRDVLLHITANACRRYGLEFPKPVKLPDDSRRRTVNVLFGGNTSERQVSLMSGTNVWLKLRQSKKYHPVPYLLDTLGNVWKLPYLLTLNHTVEEIENNCEEYLKNKKLLNQFETRVRLRLGLTKDKDTADFYDPVKMSLSEFVAKSQFVFLGLHGGLGEDGTIQKILEDRGVKYNGPNSTISKLCMDKYETAQAINKLNIAGVQTIPSQVVPLTKFQPKNRFRQIWQQLQQKLGAKTLIAKPRADGCSTGVVHLYSAKDLEKYIALVAKQVQFIPKGTFRHQHDQIEMSCNPLSEILFEKFIDTDLIRVKGNKLKYYARTGWIETTIGVIEDSGKIRVFNPSLTIAFGEVLTVEEKFQGGTGINITPPPTNIISSTNLRQIKDRIGRIAAGLQISGYSRLDAFVNTKTGDLIIIEINTLPGLTPSTVLYHQALAEKPPIYPRQLLEKLIENKGY